MGYNIPIKSKPTKKYNPNLLSKQTKEKTEIPYPLIFNSSLAKTIEPPTGASTWAFAIKYVAHKQVIYIKAKHTTNKKRNPISKVNPKDKPKKSYSSLNK